MSNQTQVDLQFLFRGWVAHMISVATEVQFLFIYSDMVSWLGLGGGLDLGLTILQT